MDIHDHSLCDKIQQENSAPCHHNENITSDCKHSKFCFSQDISSKEENLRKNATQGKANDTTLGLVNIQPRTKFVTFDSSLPRVIGIARNHRDKKSCRESDSESDENLEIFGASFLSDSDTVSSSPSEEVVNYKSQDIISKAEEDLIDVLIQLQNLWLKMDGDEDEDGNCDFHKTTLAKLGNKNLLQIVKLIEMMTEQIWAQYKTLFQTKPNPSGTTKLRSGHLEEELENSKMQIERLEAEIKKYTRENAILSSEAKDLAYIAGCQRSAERKAADVNNNKAQEAEIFYKNPHQQFDNSDSKSSAVPDGIHNSVNNFPRPLQSLLESVNGDSHNEMMVLKVENEIDSIIRDFHERFQTNNSSLNAQFQMYDEHLENWKKMLHATNDEKHEMLQDLMKIVHEHKAVLQERDNIEVMLKLLIQEKCNEDFDVQGLLHNIFMKLNEPTESGSWAHTAILESAVKTLQQQNCTQREEIYRLKHLLSESQMYCEAQANELNSCNKKFAQLLDQHNSNDAQLKIIQEEAQQKCDKIQELCNEAVSAKVGLEKKLEKKDEELKSVQDTLTTLQKANKKQQKKYHRLQKHNAVLIKEMKDSKGNMDHLAEIISQLRNGLKDQKTQWNERLRISTEEASQNKQHCDWLKAQMEQLNQQLKDAHERLKLHEMDKVQLAQQLLLAEEERRVVDRKLQELRTALQGDTGLREALIERNEALQLEINRLRHTTAQSPVGKEDSPPMEMRKTTNDLVSSAFLPATENYHVADKFLVQKNCYTTSYRRPIDFPRTAVSLHNGGVK